MESKKELRIFLSEPDRKSLDQQRCLSKNGYRPLDPGFFICKHCYCKHKVEDKVMHDQTHAKVEKTSLERLSALFSSKKT